MPEFEAVLAVIKERPSILLYGLAGAGILLCMLWSVFRFAWLILATVCKIAFTNFLLVPIFVRNTWWALVSLADLPRHLYRGLTGQKETIQPIWNPPGEEELAEIRRERSENPPPPTSEPQLLEDLLREVEFDNVHEECAEKTHRLAREAGISVATAVDATLAKRGFVRDTPRWVKARRAVSALVYGFEPPAKVVATVEIQEPEPMSRWEPF